MGGAALMALYIRTDSDCVRLFKKETVAEGRLFLFSSSLRA